jgi:LPS O-antigen subunit length determinant protein (WzzB/FepE family)
MSISIHEQRLINLREQFRAVHEANLKQLEKATRQATELAPKPPVIQPNSVDVRV